MWALWSLKIGICCRVASLGNYFQDSQEVSAAHCISEEDKGFLGCLGGLETQRGSPGKVKEARSTFCSQSSCWTKGTAGEGQGSALIWESSMNRSQKVTSCLCPQCSRLVEEVQGMQGTLVERPAFVHLHSTPLGNNTRGWLQSITSKCTHMYVPYTHGNTHTHCPFTHTIP